MNAKYKPNHYLPLCLKQILAILDNGGKKKGKKGFFLNITCLHADANHSLRLYVGFLRALQEGVRI